MLGDLGLVGGPEVAEREAELVGRLAHHVAPQPQKLAPALGAVKDKAGEDLGAEGVEAELEPRDDAEVAAAPAQGPEQIRVLVIGGADDAPVGGHELGGEQVVDREPVLALEPPRASAQCQAADARGGNAPAGRREAMLLGRAVDLGPQRAAADPGDAAIGVDLDRVHRAHVDHDAVVEQ